VWSFVGLHQAIELGRCNKLPFTTAAKQFEALASTTPMCCAWRDQSVATGLFKIANDNSPVGIGPALRPR